MLPLLTCQRRCSSQSKSAALSSQSSNDKERKKKKRSNSKIFRQHATRRRVPLLWARARTLGSASDNTRRADGFRGAEPVCADGCCLKTMEVDWNEKNVITGYFERLRKRSTKRKFLHFALPQEYYQHLFILLFNYFIKYR